MPSHRIVVFVGADLRDSTVEAVAALAGALPDARLLVVRNAASRSRGRWLRAKFRRLQREPVSYPLELCGQVFGRLRRRAPRARSAPGPTLPDLSATPPANVEVVRFDDLHGTACLDAVRAFEPWLGVSVGAPILRPELFTIPVRGTINVHKSLLPEYRGMPPAFWELHDGAEQAGVSIHQVDAGLDTGALLAQAATPIAPFATVAGLLAELDRMTVGLLVDTVRRLAAGDVDPLPQGEARTETRGRPAFLVERQVRRRLQRRRQAGGARELVKRLVFTGYTRLWAPLRNHLRARRGRCHTTVLLYHRVSDQWLDPVTVGIEQFQRHLRLLAERYEVLDLAGYLASRGQPCRRPRVVLTFDDGYADNHLAAMLLRRQGLPCTFFVSTSIVGSDRGFPHDLQKKQQVVPALTWDQVREMAAWGFTIGNHTREHTDLGQTPVPQALAEIRAASARLVEELGTGGGERWLAYPFGRRNNMTEPLRAALASAGIDCCLSAYGGVNPPDFDPADVRREGVSCAVSDAGLLALVEGWGAH